MVTYGVDHLAEYKGLLADGRVALVTSATGRSSGNTSTVDLLDGLCRLTALLGPEQIGRASCRERVSWDV